jgi:hypothetical protein
MSLWSALKRFFSLRWFVAAPWPLKILYFVLAYVLAFAVTAAIVRLQFGRDAGGQVVIFAEDIGVIIGLLCAPIFFIGILLIPFYLASMRLANPTQANAATAQSFTRLKSLAWFIAAPWPLKVLYFVLAYVLAFALIAAIVALRSGRDAAGQVVILAEDVSLIIGLVCAPVALVLLILAPLYLAVRPQLTAPTPGSHTRDDDQPKF